MDEITKQPQCLAEVPTEDAAGSQSCQSCQSGWEEDCSSDEPSQHRVTVWGFSPKREGHPGFHWATGFFLGDH